MDSASNFCIGVVALTQPSESVLASDAKEVLKRPTDVASVSPKSDEQETGDFREAEIPLLGFLF